MPQDSNAVSAAGRPLWLALTYESRPWERSGNEVASRRAKRQARGEYRASVPPFIAGAAVDLAPEVRALADDASGELARFDATIGIIAAPFTSILLRTESASSSEIENLTSSAKQVALAEIGASQSENARLVFASAALELADDLSVASIIAMHDALLAESAPDFVGSFRGEQVWIGGGGISPHEALFVPPHHERVPDLMRDLIEFASRTDVPVLVHSAIVHAQFETIHPFPDGNGRIGRAFIHSMLRHGGITRNVTVPVSAGLLQDTSRYFGALTSYRSGHLNAIVEAVSEAALAAISNGSTLVAQADPWKVEIRARRGSAPAR
ncbi:MULTISPECIES: Fic family protein [unclassified Leucobacter]|uniref:Fic family protein n=1 Tax=unclassified Leucobacter TaxID=2621730 RepID=UPI001F12B6DF|nr:MULTISPECIES: Fic family protein [unclassified Leucobacter]